MVKVRLLLYIFACGITSVTPTFSMTPPNTTEKFFETICKNDLELIETHLAAGHHPNETATAADSDSALMWAIFWGSPKIVERFLACKNVAVNYQNIRGKTALFYAVAGSWIFRLDIVIMLIKHGACVHMVDYEKNTLIRILLNHTTQNSVPADRMKVLELLLQLEAPIESELSFNQQPDEVKRLLAAAQSGKQQCIRMLTRDATSHFYGFLPELLIALYKFMNHYPPFCCASLRAHDKL